MEESKKKKVVKKTTTKKTTKSASKTTTTKKATNSTSKKKPVSKNVEKKEIKKEEPVVIEKEVTKPVVEKKKEKKKFNIKDFFKSEYGSFIIILVILTIIALAAILLADVIKNKKVIEPELNDVSIQYDEILLGSLLEQPNSTYYVLIYDEKDNNLQSYSMYLAAYEAKPNSARVYTSNIDNGFNVSFKAEESNLNVNNIMDLKVKETTLVKVSDKTVVESYEGNENITNHLKQITK